MRFSCGREFQTKVDGIGISGIIAINTREVDIPSFTSMTASTAKL